MDEEKLLKNTLICLVIVDYCSVIWSRGMERGRKGMAKKGTPNDHAVALHP